MTITSDIDVFDQTVNPARLIKVQYAPGMPKLEQIDKGGCVDLYNAEDCTLKKGQSCLINLGVCMELPQGFDGILLPRSSTFRRYHILLTNSAGYIDGASYNGPDDWWMASVYATEDTYIPKGTRCFQFRLIPVQGPLAFETVDRLGNDNRGSFGSTGR